MLLAMTGSCSDDDARSRKSEELSAGIGQDYVRPKEVPRERPTPMLGYNSAEGYWDIPFPDYSFFGHEHSWLTGAPHSAILTHLWELLQ